MTTAAGELRPVTLVAIGAVERALEFARRRVGAADITAKEGCDLVTATDVAVEDAVRMMVGGVAGSLVVGEERGGEPPADGAPYWLVDPIYRTRNFASGVPSTPSTWPSWRAGRSPPPSSAILRRTRSRSRSAAAAPGQ